MSFKKPSCSLEVLISHHSSPALTFWFQWPLSLGDSQAAHVWFVTCLYPVLCDRDGVHFPIHTKHCSGNMAIEWLALRVRQKRSQLTPPYLFVYMLDTLGYSFSSPLMPIRLYPQLLLINKSFQKCVTDLSCKENLRRWDESTDCISEWPFSLLHPVTSSHCHSNIRDKEAYTFFCLCS